MATTGLGIMQTADGTGTDPLTFRRITKAKWSNKGVITGLKVSGRTDLTYAVSAGCAVVSRSDSDGYVEAYWEGGNTSAVSAGDPSNPRIDAVWIKANDAQQGDNDNRVHVGVTQGTPAASPVSPTVPTGALIVSKMRVPANATSTNSAQLAEDGDQAIPYGASLGLLAEYIDKTTARGNDQPGKFFTMYPMKITLPTDRLVEFEFTVSANADGSASDHADWYQAFMLDGEVIPYSGGEFHFVKTSVQTLQRRYVCEVAAGTHTVACRTGLMNPAGMAPYFKYGRISGYPDECTYQGNIFRVWDRGVA